MTSRNERIDEAYRTRPNVHISYEQTIKPYHHKIAALVCKYAGTSGTVLDIGCGVGNVLSQIGERNPLLKLTAADIDENNLSITRERTGIEDIMMIDSVEAMFDSGLSYDVIVFSHVLEHTYRPLDVLLGIMKMLKPNGVAVLAVPNPVRLGIFLGNVTKLHYVNRGHVYAWDRSHWMNFLENIAGLNVIEYSHDFFPLPFINRFRLVQPLEIWLAQIFPWLAFSNIAVIRKECEAS